MKRTVFDEWYIKARRSTHGHGSKTCHKTFLHVSMSLLYQSCSYEVWLLHNKDDSLHIHQRFTCIKDTVSNYTSFKQWTIIDDILLSPIPGLATHMKGSHVSKTVLIHCANQFFWSTSDSTHGFQCKKDQHTCMLHLWSTTATVAGEHMPERWFQSGC
jgi:hypothetical protein